MRVETHKQVYTGQGIGLAYDMVPEIKMIPENMNDAYALANFFRAVKDWSFKVIPLDKENPSFGILVVRALPEGNNGLSGGE